MKANNTPTKYKSKKMINKSLMGFRPPRLSKLRTRTSICFLSVNGNNAVAKNAENISAPIGSTAKAMKSPCISNPGGEDPLAHHQR